ncbi:hypothetical protein F4780DRAFT_675696 [Xylariomycetidae sp. FL0641]|nr:hypothetical protein F4780DRAFT_675696 [Xylariomycetidae sp. FL0641]
MIINEYVNEWWSGLRLRWSIHSKSHRHHGIETASRLYSIKRRKDFSWDTMASAAPPTPAPSQAATVHVVCEAEGKHTAEGGGTLTDAQLTAEGIKQSEALVTKMPWLNQVAFVCAAPYTRCIQTFVPFVLAMRSARPVVMIEFLRELGIQPCDLPLPLDDLRRDYPVAWAEWVYPGTPAHHTEAIWAPIRADVERRAAAARELIRAIAMKAGPEAHVVVVTPRKFAAYLVEDLFGDKGALEEHGPAAWQPAEMRSFRYLNHQTGPNTSLSALTETDESRSSRKARDGKVWQDLSAEERAEYAALCEKWLQRLVQELKSRPEPGDTDSPGE